MSDLLDMADLLPSLKTAQRGLAAQRRALGAATENIANASTTETEDGDPYALKRAVREAGGEYGETPQVDPPEMELRKAESRHLSGITQQPGEMEGNPGPTTEIEEVERERLEYDPSHPHADEDGYVHYPDVNIAQEMARITSANRVYEANLSSIEATKSMVQRTFKI